MATATKIQDAKALPSVLKQPPLFTLEQLKSILKLREEEAGPLEALLGGDVRGQLDFESLIDLSVPKDPDGLPTKGMRLTPEGPPKLSAKKEGVKNPHLLRRSVKDPELREFLAKLKKSEMKAGGNPKPDYIHRGLPDRPDLPESAMQQRVKALMAEYKEIVGKKAIHPDELMAGIEAGPGRAKSLAKHAADKQAMIEKLWALDQQFADKESWSLATKFGEALIQENPGLTEKQLATVMPNLLKRLEKPGDKRTLGQAVAQFSANSAVKSADATEITGLERVKKNIPAKQFHQRLLKKPGWQQAHQELEQKARNLGVLPDDWKSKDPGDLLMATQDSPKLKPEWDALETAIEVRTPSTLRKTGPGFMEEKVEAARDATREGRAPLLQKLPGGKTPPVVDPMVAAALEEQARWKTIHPPAADTRDAYVAALAQARTAAGDATNIDVPMPTKETLARLSPEEQKALLAIRDEKIAALKKNYHQNPPDIDVQGRRNPTFQGVISDMEPEDAGVSLKGVADIGADDVEDALPPWVRKKYEKMVEAGVPHEAAVQDILGDQRWHEQVRSGRRGQSEVERLVRGSFPDKQGRFPKWQSRQVPSGRAQRNAAPELRWWLGGKGLPPADPKRLEEYTRLLTKKSPEFKGQKVEELLGPGEGGKKALGALMHRDAVMGAKLKRAIELFRAGEPEAVAMAGLGKQLQQILRMFITKL